LALVFGVIALISNKKVVVKSEVLKKNFYYLVLLLFPIIMGFDGYLSRTEGVLLIIAGLSFFLSLCIESRIFRKKYNHIKDHSLFKNISLLILSIVVLTLSANYAIKFGVDFAHGIKISPILVGLTMVSIGSCLPELFFSIKAVKTNHNSLALGDVLGTVITDATIIVGIIAVISPFYFNPLIIYVTGVAMFIAGALTIAFITTGKALNKLEGLYLIFFYICYIMTELLVNNLNK